MEVLKQIFFIVWPMAAYSGETCHLFRK